MAFYKTVNMLVDNEEKNKLPKTDNNLRDEFAKFLDKIENISTQFDDSHFYEPPTRNCKLLKEFNEITENQLIELMKDMIQTTCELDPFSSKLVYNWLDVLKGTLTKVVNLLFREGLFIQDWKVAVVKPLIKKNINLGTEFKNYRPKSNLSLVSKMWFKIR